MSFARNNFRCEVFRLEHKDTFNDNLNIFQDQSFIENFEQVQVG